MANRNNVGASSSARDAIKKPPDYKDLSSPPHKRIQNFSIPPNVPPPSTQAYGNDPPIQFQIPPPMQSLPEGYVPLNWGFSPPYYPPQPPNMPPPYYTPQAPNVPSCNILPPPYFQPPLQNMPPPSYYPPNIPPSYYTPPNIS